MWEDNKVMNRKDMREDRLPDEGCNDDEGDSDLTTLLIDAIRKVKFQKQRPCLERIYSVVRQKHRIDQQTVINQLEKAVAKGLILKVYTKGFYSYKDPGSMCNLKSRRLRIQPGTDMSKVIIKAIKELHETNGSTLRSIEKFVRRTFSLNIEEGTDLVQQLQQSLKRAVSNGLIIQEGRTYRLKRMHIRRGSSDSLTSPNFNQSLLNLTPPKHESEIIPFPNDEVDFELPEDCHDLLYSKHGVTLKKPGSENDGNKNTSGSKSAKKLMPKIKQSSTSANTPKSSVTSATLNKTPKSQSMLKSETKSSSDINSKTNKQEVAVSSKASKVKRSSSPPSNKSSVKSESSSLTKEDSPDILTISNKKNSKLERGSSPAVLKKKVEPVVTNNVSKKVSKNESSGTNESKQTVKTEMADASATKKVKSEKDQVNISKKGKTAATSPVDVVSTKKTKTDTASNMKKKSEQESVSSSSKKTIAESSSAKQVKAEVKNSSLPSKGSEAGTPPPSGSRKSSPVVKVKANESAKKLKRPKVEENSKKSTPASKRRRL